MEVDFYKRKLTAIHHTATHLLHSALRKILGSHAYQAGSLVDYDRLRFDFTHFQALTDIELKNIEDLVNEKILKELDVLIEYKPLNVALQEGAIALFTEKYPENVRTVKIVDKDFISYELCAGTHVKNTSFIGTFKILSEKSLQLGVRRIEAVCNLSLLPIFNKFSYILNDLTSLTNTDVDKIKNYISKLIEESKNLKQNLINIKKKYYQLCINQTNLFSKNVFNFNLLEEDDLLLVHDLIKTKNPLYFGIYYVENLNKYIFIFNQNNNDELMQLFNRYNLKLINLGSYKKVVINDSKIYDEIITQIKLKIAT